MRHKTAKHGALVVYDPAVESFPDLPFFALNPDEFAVEMSSVCDRLCPSIASHTAIDPRIEKLKQDAESAKETPKRNMISLAVLGEQGNGKSSLINALLDRSFLATGGGAAACTRYATIIEHKKSAMDRSQQSDIAVRLFDSPEMRHLIDEQISSWAEYFPRVKDHGDNEDSLFITEAEVEHVEQYYYSVTSDEAQRNKRMQETATAAAAREFLECIFNMVDDEETCSWLEESLDATNIDNESFKEQCVIWAERQFNSVKKMLGTTRNTAKVPEASRQRMASEKSEDW